jgi:predicted PurR-regulated permease PerM
MGFDLATFIRTNKVIFIWSAFFLLMYLVRGLFGLVFLTFILCYIFNNIIQRLSDKTRLPRRLWTIIIYLIFIALVTTLISFVAPKLGHEGTNFLRQAPLTLDRIRGYLDQLAAQQPNFAPIIIRVKQNFTVEKLLGMDRQTLITFALASFNQVTHYFSYFLLGTLFSFFILFDFPNLRQRLMALRNTRLRGVYEETAESVVQFALVVGEAFQAQIIIAFINTVLTMIGLLILGIHPVVLLASIVFFCGLIPVLGVFISSVPILLLAFNIGGFNLQFWALVMIIGVHTIEAYILNPRIFSAVFKINPVLTLIILYIGHRLFGMWGVLLGVPISVYIYRFAIVGERRRSEAAQALMNGNTAVCDTSTPPVQESPGDEIKPGPPMS